jgi:hypothetical protein
VETLAAVSADEHLLGVPFDASIHSRFDRALNVVCRDGWVVTIAAAGVGNGPDTIVLKEPSVLHLWATCSSVSSDGTNIMSGNGPIVSMAGVVKWRPRRPVRPRGGLAQRLGVLREITASEGRHCCDGLLAGPSRNIATAAERCDADALRSVCHEIIGLGPGLTPAADDLLSGLAAGVGYLSPYATRARLLSEPLNAAILRSANRTTFLSEAMIRHAVAGRSPERSGNVLEALCSGTPDLVSERTRELLALGDTSGTAVALGIHLAFQLAMPEVGSVWAGNGDTGHSSGGDRWWSLTPGHPELREPPHRSEITVRRDLPGTPTCGRVAQTRRRPPAPLLRRPDPPHRAGDPAPVA